jgi:hypothetical protein
VNHPHRPSGTPSSPWGTPLWRTRGAIALWTVLAVATHLHCDPPEPTTPAAQPASIRRPTAADVQRALDAGDLTRAHRLLAAIEHHGGSAALSDIRDAVVLADAEQASGASKLVLLSVVIQRGGSHADGARELARTEEIREIRDLLDAGRPADAIATLDEFFDESTPDPEAKEARARAHELQAKRCGTPACIYRELAAANASAASPARSQQADAARSAVLASFHFEETPAESPANRLVRLREFRDVATATASDLSSDVELSRQARTATAWAQSERDKTPLLGNTEAVARELLGELDEPSPAVAMAALGAAHVYLTLDAQKICRGVYAVGASAGARPLDATEDGAHIISQALGHPSKVRDASPTTTFASWSDGGTRIVARWRSGTLMELRIGDAAP